MKKKPKQTQMPINKLDMQNNEIRFKGQNIYLGIDVHKKNWQVSVSADMPIKRDEFHMTSNNVEGLLSHLQAKYPGATYYSAYESGFCGFSSHRRLIEAGIRNIVVNAADVPTTQKASVTKTDAVDAKKLSEALKNGMLNGIHVPTEEEEGVKNLQRKRDDYVKKLGGTKSQIKHFLHRNGIDFESEFREGAHWTSSFIQWLKELDLSTHLKLTLEGYLEDYEYLKRQAAKFEGYLRTYMRENRMDDLEKIASVPGIGIITSMTFLSEIGDFSRFNNQRAFASYIGLSPTCHDSGEKKNTGEITFRSNRRLRTSLIESAWVAVKEDDSLRADFLAYKRRMDSCNAIVRIARKLANRILHVMKERDVYVIKEADGGERVKNTFPITRKKTDALSLPQQTANEQISGESNNREGAAPRQPKEI